MVENEIEWRGRVLYMGTASSGVDVEYHKTKRMLSIGGWYDHVVGIPATQIPLGEFLRGLGVTKEDCIKALDAAAVAQEGR